MNEGLSYIDTHDVDGVKFGLENILELLESLDNPHNKLKAIHIAGTNGKGSVGAYLLYTLIEAGLKVGRLSSPAVFHDYEFAMIGKKINSEICEEYITKDYLDNKLEYIDNMELRTNPSGFEMQVAISMAYFLDSNCDIVIIETGMGGSKDATNVFKETLCDVITPISLDHTNMLGNSIEEIAKVKCGIITNQADVVTTSCNNVVMNIIETESCRKSANLHIANYNDVKHIDLYNQCNTFVYKEEKYEIRQNGEYQINNAIIAIEVINVLNKKGYSITKENLVRGLRKSYIRGRFDVIEILDIDKKDNKCTIVVDGAHNVHGMESLIKSLNIYFPEKSRVYILSVFKDKNYKKMLELVSKDASKVILFNNDNVRSLEKEIIKYELTLCGKSDNNIYICNGIGEAVDKAASIAYESNSIIVCAGSLSFMKDLYERLNYNG